MTHFDFNSPLNRYKQKALKYHYYPEDVLPLWIADSDYAVSPAIQDSLAEHATQAVYGYQLAEHVTELNESVLKWLAAQHNWQIEAEWLVWVPGIMVGANSAARALTEQGDVIHSQMPNYPPLHKVAENNHRITSYYTTTGSDGDWHLDWDNLEQHMAHQKGGMMILTNPMNPCGSVLSNTELQRLAELCQRYDVVLCSDEVHCDLILDDVAHTPAGSVPELMDRSVTLMSASKTFNIAGLATSFAVIPNKQLRKRFYHETIAQQYWVNSFGIQATIAAFAKSHDWHAAQRQHLLDNREYLFEQINKIDGLSYTKAPATYLAWIDASDLAVDDKFQWFMDKKVGVSAGKDFGWDNFVRLNFACPRSHLEMAIERLSAA